MAEKRYRIPDEYQAVVDDFPKIRQTWKLYIDKTAYIHNMTRLNIASQEKDTNKIKVQYACFVR